MAGKKFAAEFALRRNVSALDKILIQDSDDDVVKYAYPPQIAALSGYAYAKSIADLPLMPSNKSIGYIVGQMLYIYVGMGGDTKDGLYQSVGFFVGPQGVQGEKGEQGEQGEQGIQGPKGDNGGLSLQELDEYLATKQYVTGDTLAEMLTGYVSNTSLMRDYVTIAKTQDVTGVKNFTAGLQFGGVPMYKSKGDTVFLDGNLVVRGGITAFSSLSTPVVSLFEALPIDGTTIKRDPVTNELYVDTNVVGGSGGGSLDEEQLEEYLKPYAKTADVASTYATKSSVNALSTQLNDFLSGKANKATTLAGYGITDAYTKSHIDRNFVTIGTKQEITGEKDFVGGFKVNGGLVEYNATLKTWVFNGDLLVTGGVAAFSNISGFKPSTITEAVLIDNKTIKLNADGLLYAVAQETGGINEDQLEEYLRPYATQDWVTGKGYITSASSITGNASTATKLQNAVSLWGRTFDGSADLTGSLNVTTGEGYRITYNNYDLRFIISGNSSNRGIWDNTNSEWMMYRNSSTNVFFPQGNVGFGTTSPTEKVTVNGNINLSGAYNYKIQGKDVVSIYSTNYYLADSAIELGYNTFVVGRKINFQTSTTTTKATTATLDGSGNFSITGVLKLPAVDSGFTNPRITFGESVIRIGATTAGLLGVYASGDIRLNPNSASSANNAMGLFLKATGLNGVNNNAPTEALDVAGNILASGTMRLSTLASNAFTGAQLLWGNGEARIGVNASSNRMTMYAESFRFRTAASVASSSVGVDIDVSGNLLATGGITATNSSDERLKRNLRKFNASKVLMSLGGVWEYEYIDSEVQKNHIYEGTHYGLIYQHVKGTTLDVMCHEREDGFGTLNYIHPKFISLIAGATMENISEVEKLKRKIRHLENKVKQLEQRA